MLRITLTNIKEEFTIEDADPIGINELVYQIKRSAESEGIFFEVIIGLKFLKRNGLEFLNNSFRLYGGLDAVVLVTVREYDPNSRIWEVYAEGKVNFNRKSKFNDTLETNIEQVGQQTSILNALNTDVNLGATSSFDDTFDLSGGSDGIEVGLHSKKLLRTYSGETDLTNAGNNSLTAGDYFVLIALNDLVSEIQEKFSYPTQIADEDVLEFRKYQFKAKEAGDYTLDLHIYYHYINAAYWDVSNHFIYYLVYGRPGAYTTIVINDTVFVGGPTEIGFTVQFDYNNTITLEVGDEVYLYSKFTAPDNSIYNVVPYDELDDTERTTILITALTETAPSTCRAQLLFEAVERILQYHSNGKVLLDSTLLGRTDLGYDEDGEASLIVWTNGNCIRQLGDKKIFANLAQILQFLKAGFCASYGFKLVDNQWYMVIEKLPYFYDNTTQVVRLAGQYDFEELTMDERYYRQIVYGYTTKVDVKQVNGIDDFNTLRCTLPSFLPHNHHHHVPPQ